MKKTRKFSRTFSILLALTLLLGCIPPMQLFASESPRAATQSIITSDGTNTSYETLPFSPASYGSNFQDITTKENHHFKDITLYLDFRASASSAPTVKVQGHEFTSFTYDDSDYMLEVALKNVQAYASPTNNAIRVEVTYAGKIIYVSVRTTDANTSIDTSMPYLSGMDMWDGGNEQLPNVYSPVVVAQKAHRYTYHFNGALIMPDAESFQVKLDGISIEDPTVTKKISLGYGMSLYEFSLRSFSQIGFRPDSDGYSTVDFIGTSAAGYESHVLLKCRFVYR